MAPVTWHIYLDSAAELVFSDLQGNLYWLLPEGIMRFKVCGAVGSLLPRRVLFRAVATTLMLIDRCCMLCCITRVGDATFLLRAVFEEITG